MTPVHHAINYVEITVTDMDAPSTSTARPSAGGSPTMRRPTLASRHPRVTARSAVSVSARTSSPVDRSSWSTPTTSTPPSPLSRMPAARSPRSHTHTRADGASPSSTRAGTGSAYGAQPRQHAVREERSGRMLIRRPAVGPLKAARMTTLLGAPGGCVDVDQPSRSRLTPRCLVDPFALVRQP
jgi:hypothetical protein